MWGWYIRWRHSKGFGMHSHFAYRFVTDVLKPGIYGYYAYLVKSAIFWRLPSKEVSFSKTATALS